MLIGIEDVDSGANNSMDHERWFSNVPDYVLFGLFQEATTLAQQLCGLNLPSVTVIRRLMPRVSDLLHCVQSWQPKISSAAKQYERHITKANEIWREGLLCYIYSDICALESSGPRIQECVRKGLQAVKDLPLLQMAIWPLFMIAVHAAANEDRAILEKSYKELNATAHFATPLAIVELLRKTWADMDKSGCAQSRWRQIMTESGLQINLVV